MIEDRVEEEAIALALDLSALIVLDDKRARNYARGWVAANRHFGRAAQVAPPGACFT